MHVEGTEDYYTMMVLLRAKKKVSIFKTKASVDKAGN